jgi:hypothetical protein
LNLHDATFRFTYAFSTQIEELVSQLSEVSDAKWGTLDNKKAALEQLHSLTDNCIDFVSNAINTGSDMAL